MNPTEKKLIASFILCLIAVIAINDCATPDSTTTLIKRACGEKKLLKMMKSCVSPNIDKKTGINAKKLCKQLYSDCQNPGCVARKACADQPGAVSKIETIFTKGYIKSAPALGCI